jgi:phosphatidylserine/phosphatidylglycerophosphate/cardiolipin synthase-like enzyme
MFVLGLTLGSSAKTPRQKSLDEWRSLTALPESPRVFVKSDNVRFYFHNGTNVEEFNGHWSRLRVPTDGYRVNSALLEWKRKLLKVPERERGWRQATVISGADWRRLATNILQELAPLEPGQGYYYQAFLTDRLLYRDTNGTPRLSALNEQPKGVTLDRRFTVDESLEILARVASEHLAATHPGETLFVIISPNAGRFAQPLLLDRQQRECVLLSPSALYDPTERGLGLTFTVQGVSAMVFESHGLALLKNPVSSAARLGDLGVQTLIRLTRLPVPKATPPLPLTSNRPGMDLKGWEAWLDRYTGTRREDGSLDLMIDGDRFFSRLRQTIAAATNHIDVNVFIFDKDDVAVDIADRLKQRSADANVRVILDRMGSLAAGASPPATPLPLDFVPPSSISSYLTDHSRVQVRPFLNPWLSADHCKTYIVDGQSAWLGGMNLGREYLYEWHDMMVELRGPVVESLEREFRHDWAHAGPLGDFAFAASLLGRSEPQPSASTSWIKLRLLPTKTFWKPFSMAVLNSMRKAQSYIYVENPYLFDKRVMAALVEARRRGVDVRVVLPRENDFKYGSRANLVAANYFFDHGIRVYFYPGMTHVKALLVDGWSCVGSGNLNHISLRLSQEQNVATSDPAFADRLKHELFEEDFINSYELNHTISVDWADFLADMLLENL